MRQDSAVYLVMADLDLTGKYLRVFDGTADGQMALHTAKSIGGLVVKIPAEMVIGNFTERED